MLKHVGLYLDVSGYRSACWCRLRQCAINFKRVSSDLNMLPLGGRMHQRRVSGWAEESDRAALLPYLGMLEGPCCSLGLLLAERQLLAVLLDAQVQRLHMLPRVSLIHLRSFM